MPWDTIDVATSDYLYVHVVRNQECTHCSAGTLYQLEEMLSMIGSDDVPLLFIIEPNQDDTIEEIESALLRRPIAHQVIIDWSHDLLIQNPWLVRTKYLDVNDFILDCKNVIVSRANPFQNFRDMKDLL